MQIVFITEKMQHVVIYLYYELREMSIAYREDCGLWKKS